jgi:hypothetical protein
MEKPQWTRRIKVAINLIRSLMKYMKKERKRQNPDYPHSSLSTFISRKKHCINGFFKNLTAFVGFFLAFH